MGKNPIWQQFGFMGRGRRSLKSAAVQQLAAQCPVGTVLPNTHLVPGKGTSKVVTAQFLVWQGRVKMLDCSLLPAKSNTTWKNNADIIRRK